MTDAIATRTTCPYCGVGCGIRASVGPGGAVAIAGDPTHPANFGRLCSKGAALGETMSLDGRLLHPEIAGARATWDTALDLVAARFREAIAAHGPDSVAFYVSGQILTEDYYAANKLMKGFIGSANIDTNSRLCMASSVAGHKRAFGSDTVPGCYEDLECADLVVLVGSNLAWCHPVLFQRLAAAREARGTKVVVIDPRVTPTTEIADLHLAIRPGADVALFNGLLAHLVAAGHVDRGYVSNHTRGLGEALAVATGVSLGDLARDTDLDPAAIAEFYELFAATPLAVTVYSQGVNQSSAGTDKVNAIINCHLATGRIGKPGMGPFSVTGQPNAMGGRETGGLANMLAAHMELADADHRRIVADFWGAPRLAERPGLKAVDLFRAVGEGRIKALWIMATNPVVSLPDADAVARALETCPFVVVSDVVRETDTTAFADVLLPSAAWGEKDGTVTNSERRISRQRSFLPLPGEARPDWWQFAEVARRLGFGPAFAWTSPVEIFAEYAELTATANDGTRDLDLGAFSHMTREAYDGLEPFQWPRPAGSASSSERFFASGGFYTPDRRARFVPTPYRLPVERPGPGYPFILNTGRLRDQWHTMTRTERSARLMAHAPEPFVVVHPDDAAEAGVAEGDIAELTSRHGRALARVVECRDQARASLFVPMHWTRTHATASRIGAVAGPATDPVSGQPELKHTAAALARYPARWHAFAVSKRRPEIGAMATLAGYATVARVTAGWRLELAGTEDEPHWEALARDLADPGEAPPDVLAYIDTSAGQRRLAVCADGRLAAAIFVSRRPLVMAREWAASMLGVELGNEERWRILAGRPGPGRPERGPVVCACLEVGRNEIIAAVVEGGAATVAAVGACTGAGTNCGSCRSEIGRLLDEARLAKAG